MTHDDVKRKDWEVRGNKIIKRKILMKWVNKNYKFNKGMHGIKYYSYLTRNCEIVYTARPKAYHSVARTIHNIFRSDVLNNLGAQSPRNQKGLRK